MSSPLTASQSCGETRVLKRAIQHWNMIYVDIARGPGSAIRVLTSSERVANQLKINETGEVGHLVTKAETNAPKIGKLGDEERDG